MPIKTFKSIAALRALGGLILLGVTQFAYALLPIEHWRTSAGAQVYFVANRSLPILDVSVDFPAGSGFDVASRAGVASMTSGLMRLGAGGMSEDDIARRMADIGAILGGRFDSDRAGVSLRTLSEPQRREVALDIVERILRAPEFPAAVLEREKKRLIGALKEADLKPDTQAARLLYRLVFRDHPYALRASGEVSTVGQISRELLVDFYRRHYVAERAVLAIMGDVTRAEAEAIAERLTQGLPRASAELPRVDVAPLPAAVTRVVAHPAAQSHIQIGAPGIRRDDPDYFTLFVGNHILGGGGFVSRINEEVRQKRGLAYSAYSYFAPLRSAGPFVIGMQTQRAQAEEALAVVRGVLRDFIDKGPTEAELHAAKQNIIGGFPMRIDNNRKIHDYLGLIGFFNLPIDYLETFPAKIAQVTVADIRRAFAKRIHPDRLVTVVVGADRDISAATPMSY